MTDRADRVEEPGHEKPAARCPNCGMPTVAAFRPFCSPRCADVDLHRWLGGVYAVPASEEDADEEPAPGS